MTSLEREIARLHDEMVNAPHNIELKLKYGHACLMRDWRLEALSVYEEVLNVEDNAEAHLALAKIYALQTYYSEAYDELRKLFNVDPINMQGHIMLHLLQESLPVPEDLAQHLDFVPSSDYLIEQRKVLLADRDFLDSQVAEYSALVFGVPEPEPILQYCVLETRKSKERLAKLLAKCDEWAKSALPGGFIKDSVDSTSTEASVPALVTETDVVAPVEPAEVASSNIEAEVTNGDENASATEEGGEPVEVAASESTEQAVENAPAPSADDGEDMHQAPSDSGAIAVEDTPVNQAPSASGSGMHSAVDANTNDISDAPAPEPHFEVQPEAEVAPEPQAEYSVDRERVNELMEPLFNIRGVNSAILVRRGTGLVLSVGTAASSAEHLDLLCEGMAAWTNLNDTLNCWIIEGESGIEYIHKIGSDFLLVIDSTSTNLGALRIGIDKIVPDLEKVL